MMLIRSSRSAGGGNFFRWRAEVPTDARFTNSRRSATTRLLHLPQVELTAAAGSAALRCTRQRRQQLPQVAAGRRSQQQGDGDEKAAWGKDAATAGLSADRLGYILWALAVGASVTMRLWCSVQLAAGAGDMDPFVVSCHIASRSLLLSAVCLMPFASLQALPKTMGPWLAGICTLPSSSLIASASTLGLGLSQMILKLSTLSTALALDTASGKLASSELWRRMLGTGVVLAGITTAALSHGGGGAAVTFGPVVLLCLLGTAASGAGYVLQTRLSTVSSPPPLTTGAPAERAEATAAVVAQLTSAVVQIGILGFLTLRGATTLGALPVRSSDAPLWAFEALQGAFFLRSMQMLSRRVGLATTFTTSLCGQLLMATALDVLQGGGGATSLGRLAGLGLVVCGAVVCNGSDANRGPKPVRSSRPVYIVDLKVKSSWPFHAGRADAPSELSAELADSNGRRF